MTQHTTRNIRLLFLFWFLREFQLWIPVWIVFLTLEQGFSLTNVTTAEGIYLVGVVLLEVPTGAVADRWGRSRSLALGALALGASILIFAFTTSFPVLLASFLLWSVATTLMSGADSAVLYDTLKVAGREAEYERLAGRGAAFNWAGVGLATLLGGPVAEMFDIRATIFLGAATCLATATVAFLLWEPPRTEASEGAPTRYLASIGHAFRDIWNVPALRTVVLLTGGVYAALDVVGYLSQPYLVDRGIEVGTWFSLLQVPMFAAGLGGSLLAGMVRDRGGTTPALIAIPVLGAAGYFALAASPGLTAYAAFPVVYALVSCLQPLATGYVNRAVPSERRATVLSMHSMVSSLLLAGLSPGAGAITDHLGLAWAFSAAGVATLAVLIVFALPLLATRREAPVELPATEAA
ncbi:MAG: MFS transporter [Hyphomicrobiales bacterium]